MCLDTVSLCSLSEVHETFFLVLPCITGTKPASQPVLYIARNYTQKARNVFKNLRKHLI